MAISSEKLLYDYPIIAKFRLIGLSPASLMASSRRSGATRDLSEANDSVSISYCQQDSSRNVRNDKYELPISPIILSLNKTIAKFRFIGALHTAKNADHIVATTTRSGREGYAGEGGFMSRSKERNSKRNDRHNKAPPLRRLLWVLSWQDKKVPPHAVEQTET